MRTLLLNTDYTDCTDVFIPSVRDYLLEVIVDVMLYQGASIQLGIELLDETVNLAVFNVKLLRGTSLGIDVKQNYHGQLLQHHVYQAVTRRALKVLILTN